MFGAHPQVTLRYTCGSCTYSLLETGEVVNNFLEVTIVFILASQTLLRHALRIIERSIAAIVFRINIRSFGHQKFGEFGMTILSRIVKRSISFAISISVIFRINISPFGDKVFAMSKFKPPQNAFSSRNIFYIRYIRRGKIIAVAAK